ncbi:MAG: [protein-PII] uridylyltransferase [Burkholderiales bacterium]|jgi:[protein-PII] uridylyltransferase|nr:[protein-PII] uridylyltransferase [Burkholderiales bacterium]
MNLSIDTATVTALRQKLQEEREKNAAAFLSGLDIFSYLTRAAKSVDTLMRGLWTLLPESLTQSCALIAIGGYGRNALFPESDIDTMILWEDALSEEHRAALVMFETALWDFGLNIGHRVHSLDDINGFNEFPIDTQTALLEHRFLSGNRKIYRKFTHKLKDVLDFSSFCEAKRFEQEQRYLKYGDVVYNLEPNLKEGPGGLRDIHLIRWIDRAKEVVFMPGDRPLFLTPSERHALRQHERQVSILRAHVHLLSKRAENRLLFDHQNTIAERLHVAKTRNRLAGEVLMQRYYRAAQKIRRLNMLFLQTVYEWAHPIKETIALDQDFIQRGALLDIRNQRLFATRPKTIFDAFLHWQKHHDIESLSANVLRALNAAEHTIGERFRKNPLHREQFVDFFRGGVMVTHGTRLMNLYGLLGRYLPDFGKIVGQMQHDLFHIYTVDEHTLTVIRNLRRFCLDAHAHEFPLCSRLMMDFQRKEVLYFAALFHDIAKGRGGDHSELGAIIAKRFCRQHDLPKKDAALIVWLVKMHLKMSHVSQKQDISNPDVVTAFTELVGDERRLIALFLLTTADIRATSPKVWTPWRAQLLESLFLLTRARLTQDHIPDSLESKQEAVRNAIKNILPDHAEATLWQTMDDTYFQRHTAEELVWHVTMLHDQCQSITPVVHVRTLPNRAGLQFLIFLPDTLGLFARLCVFFGTHALNILESQIHTTQKGYALDVFIVHPADAELLDHPDHPKLHYLRDELTRFLNNPIEVNLPKLGKPSRRLHHYPLQPQVRILSDGAGEDYVLEIVVGDRSGLLAHIATQFVEAGINVKSARINTMDERVEDVFVLTGDKLHLPEFRVALELKLQSILEAK